MRKREERMMFIYSLKLGEVKNLPYFKNFLRWREGEELTSNSINVWNYVEFLKLAHELWRIELKRRGCFAPTIGDFIEERFPAVDFEVSEEVEEDSSE